MNQPPPPEEPKHDKSPSSDSQNASPPSPPEATESSTNPPTTETPPLAKSPESASLTEGQWSAIAHLSALLPVLGPVIIWLWKKDQSKQIEANAQEALNFSLSFVICATLAFLVFSILDGIPIIGILFGILGTLLITILWLAYFILIILCAFKTNKTEIARYPISLRLIK